MHFETFRAAWSCTIIFTCRCCTETVLAWPCHVKCDHCLVFIKELLTVVSFSWLRNLISRKSSLHYTTRNPAPLSPSPICKKCVLLCGVKNPDIPSSWPLLFSSFAVWCAPSHYTSLFISLSNLKTWWVKGNWNIADHKSFHSAFQQDESSGSTEDAEAPIKTVFVHRAQCASSAPRRDREMTVAVLWWELVISLPQDFNWVLSFL